MDLEDIVVPTAPDYVEVEDIEIQNARSEMADFENACDLLEEFIDEDVVVDDPLTFVPKDVSDFNALRESIKPMVEGLTPEEKLKFLEDFISKATEKLPSFIIEDIAKSLK